MTPGSSEGLNVSLPRTMRMQEQALHVVS